MTNPKMMNSGRPRIKDDDYKTIDPRCVNSLLDFIVLQGCLVVDPCSPTGSGIIEQIASRKIHCYGLSNYREDYACDWVVSNPPYKRPLVDNIVWNMISRLDDGLITGGVALLLRTNFDHAKGRVMFFRDNPHYYGQIKLMFRPRWFEKREGDATPFHNYVWHIWTTNTMHDSPIVMYSEGK